MNPKAVRPTFSHPNHRVQAVTPMPQVTRTNMFRPMAHSPPPFEAPNPSLRFNNNDDIFIQMPQIQQTTNISLLSRGITLLSITQLRDLLRDYSLPTGGNKHVLVNRLIIFLETFGQNQQNLLNQFSTKLKKLLSVEAEDHSSSSPQFEENLNSPPQQYQSLPSEITNQFLLTSPTCLYEPTDIIPAFGPFLIQQNISFNFNLTSPGSNLIPILQFSNIFPNTILSRIVLSINNVYLNLRHPIFWADLKELIDKSINVQIISIEPTNISIIVVVRWLKIIPILQLVQNITERDFPQKIPLNNLNKSNSICPLTHKIITKPARGYTCMHGECFDLTGFLCYSLKNNSWQCPICRKTLLPEDLRIDPYLFSLINNNNKI